MREGLRYARSVPELWVPLVMMAIVGTLLVVAPTAWLLLHSTEPHKVESTSEPEPGESESKQPSTLTSSASVRP